MEKFELIECAHCSEVIDHESEHESHFIRTKGDGCWYHLYCFLEMNEATLYEKATQ
ncbi:hypothetical protein ACFFJY_09390 [Fictibacillus aquaticus]|uniref:hypothetical protein n=1 Tax=Fictibacillus aquaticus TaxID=2021314 RepID=UPI0013FE1B42|nr:hypothetical protein [Fictibacillus aquaticus]